MAFLSSESLKKILSKLISNPNETNVKHGAYELSLGPEVFVTDEKYKTNLSIGQHINIPPGQFALLLTEEVVTVPDNMIAFISIKANIKFKGLVNVSGFHVDPGFKGRLKYSVYNAGSKDAVLSCGLPTFLIWFSYLDRKTKDVYNGKKMNQMSITPDDVINLKGEMASPSSLDKRLQKIEMFISIAKGILITVIGGLFLWFLTIGIMKEQSASSLATPMPNSVTPTKIPLQNQIPEKSK
jgi:dCTP deaminase